MLRTALAMLVASVAADDTKCTEAADCADAGEKDTCFEITYEAADADGVDEDAQKEFKKMMEESSVCIKAEKCTKGEEDAAEAEKELTDEQKTANEEAMKLVGYKSGECVTHSAGSAAVPIIIVIVVLGAIGAVVGLKMKKKACFADKPNEGGYTESMI